MCLYRSFIALVFMAGVVQCQSQPNPEFRQYTCIEHEDADVTECRLTFMTTDDEPITITDSGCFMEKEPKKQELRNFCPLQCTNSDFAYVIGRRPLENSACREDETFNIVRRRNDWFLWRSGDCLSEEIQFDVGCINSASLETDVVVGDSLDKPEAASPIV
uniref:Secreted protein n=1 Tax=Panagrellus redivivus TaxID=6233 RepID=A0A7E4V8U5_PANRE